MLEALHVGKLVQALDLSETPLGRRIGGELLKFVCFSSSLHHVSRIKWAWSLNVNKACTLSLFKAELLRFEEKIGFALFSRAAIVVLLSAIAEALWVCY